MNKKLTDTDKMLLSKALEGECSVFRVLNQQIDYLYVKESRRKAWSYHLEVEIRDEDIQLLDDVDANIQISGTQFNINESESTLYVTIEVRNGHILWVNFNGDYDFQKKFTIKKIFWENRNDNPVEEGHLIFEPSERDCQMAISYMPTYK
jgi:hypothetical protein